VQETLVFGDGWVTAELPDDTRVVSSGMSLPLTPIPDLAASIQEAVERPLDIPPLREVARGASRVTLAFDDPTVPCYAPLWAAAMPILLGELERAGVPERGVTLLCANALHRKFTPAELEAILGPDVVRRFVSDGRLVCHDAEDPQGLVHLGTTPEGHDVEVNRLVADSDLTVYLNASTTRGFSGGWKSICVGLSSYRSIRWHHTPDTMSMSTEKNRMHDILDEMGRVFEGALGEDRVFKLETILSNPLEIHRVLAGSVWATRREVLEVTRTHQQQRRDLLPEKADVVLYGVPDWSPYAAFSFLNPILTLISTGLGYLGGMIQAIGKPGCTVILATPCPDRWDDVHHPSYREVWDRVLPVTRNPYEARELFEPELSARSDYIEKYRFGYGFHPVHAVMALYPLKRLRHAGRVIVAGADDPSLPAHVGFDTADTVETALAEATSGQRDVVVAFIRYPAAVNRA
jgi:lactate racemase